MAIIPASFSVFLGDGGGSGGSGVIERPGLGVTSIGRELLICREYRDHRRRTLRGCDRNTSQDIEFAGNKVAIRCREVEVPVRELVIERRFDTFQQL